MSAAPTRDTSGHQVSRCPQVSICHARESSSLLRARSGGHVGTPASDDQNTEVGDALAEVTPGYSAAHKEPAVTRNPAIDPVVYHPIVEDRR